MLSGFRACRQDWNKHSEPLEELPTPVPRLAWMTNRWPAWVSLQMLKGSLWVLLTQRASGHQSAGCLLFRAHGQDSGYWLAKTCTCEGTAFDWIQLLSLELIKCFCTGQKGPHTITAFVFLRKPQELLKKVHRLLILRDFKSGRKNSKQFFGERTERSIQKPLSLSGSRTSVICCKLWIIIIDSIWLCINHFNLHLLCSALPKQNKTL